MKRTVLKLFAVVMTAMLCLCSCQHVQRMADAVVSSAGAEISSALSEAESEFRDGISEVTSAIESITGDISSIGEIVSDHVESALSEAADEIEANMTEAPAADETTEPAAKQYTFRDKKKYDEHYKKHGAEFGDITKEQYLQMANDLINSTSDRVLHKMSKDGDYLFFDQDTGYFLVLSDDDYIRTFFIPSAGKKYYDKQ